MPTRILRDGILESERVDALSVEAELFYRRLMSRADDHGRYTADPVLLRSNLYPRRVDRISLDQVELWLAECSMGDDPLVIVYQVLGKRYLEIVNFGQRIRTESKFPSKPESCPTAANVREMRQPAATCGNPPQPAAECGTTRARGRTKSETESETKSESETNASDAAQTAPPVGDLFDWLTTQCQDAGIVVEPDLWREFPNAVNSTDDVRDLRANLPGWLEHPRYSGGMVTARKLIRERQWKRPAVFPNSRASPRGRPRRDAFDELLEQAEREERGQV